jgi:hypothetical protein
MKTKLHSLFFLLALLAGIHQAAAQGSAFTYQGWLNSSGSPATGSYDLAFTLYTTNVTGSVLAGPVTNTAVAVTNGLFTTLVDFGNAYTGTSNWLEIAVSTNAANSFTTLAPRQQLTPVPYAITAANLSGTIPLSQLPGSIITNNASGVNVAGTFAGNGSGLTNVPGAVPWQVVSGTNQTASANAAYLLTNNSPDTLTLPSSANVGDIVRVSGVGTNGWNVQPGAGQTLAGFGYASLAGVTWTAQSNAPSANWFSVASSGDGSHLVAVVYNGQIYTSNDGGVTWTAQSGAPSTTWFSVASSADGSHLVAVVQTSSGGAIYTSTNSGVTWTAQSGAPNVYWTSVASSADGSHLSRRLQAARFTPRPTAA